MAVTRRGVSLRPNRGGCFGGLEIPSFGRTGQAREVEAVIANTTWGARAKDGMAVSYAPPWADPHVTPGSDSTNLE